ncbi:hypothetical protein ACFX1S_027693 [Malus domestica]
MNSDGKPQGLHLRPHKGTYLGSFYFLDSALPKESCSTRLARRDLPDETCPTTPDSEAEVRQQPSTGANLQGSCVLVSQETSPTGIPDANRIICG